MLIRRNGDLPLQVFYSPSADSHAFAPVLAPQLASSLRNLPRKELLFTEFVRPIGDKSGVRAAGHRIFRNAGSRREKARNKITIVPGRCGDYPAAIYCHELAHIGSQRAN